LLIEPALRSAFGNRQSAVPMWLPDPRSIE
jgi:hypothetical protein